MTPKELRIIFFGTPEIAAYQLEYLISEGYNVVCVVTQPDKPSGRGQKIIHSAVKQCALEHLLPLLQPERLRDEAFVAQIRDLKPDVQIVMAYRMIPQCVFSIPSYGTFNIHTSLLPSYRGAAPINRAIMNGETQSGITTFLLDEAMDTGGIIHSETIPISDTMTAGELHDRMMQLTPSLIERTLSTLLLPESERRITPQPRQGNFPSAPKIHKADMQIDWTKSGKEIVNLIRGLSPYPAAFAAFSEQNTDKIHRMKIFEARFLEQKTDISDCGKVFFEKNKQMFVLCRDGAIEVLDVQLSGKKRMKTDALLRGLRIENPLSAIAEE